MLDNGRYIAARQEGDMDDYHITVDFKETEKSYILTLIENDSRYGASQIEDMFRKNKRVLIKKSGDKHCVKSWDDNSFTLYPYRVGVPYLFEMPKN